MYTIFQLHSDSVNLTSNAEGVMVHIEVITLVEVSKDRKREVEVACLGGSKVVKLHYHKDYLNKEVSKNISNLSQISKQSILLTLKILLL